MVKEFEKLEKDEVALLLRAPALVSVLAAGADEELREIGKADAIELAHLRTFTAPPLLRPFYREVEKIFRDAFDAIAERYTPLTDNNNRKSLLGEIDDVHKVLGKLDPGYARALNQSLNSYTEHVRKSERNIFEYFIFPFPVPGVTD